MSTAKPRRVSIAFARRVAEDDQRGRSQDEAKRDPWLTSSVIQSIGDDDGSPVLRGKVVIGLTHC
jgi:hypothetical protein